MRPQRTSSTPSDAVARGAVARPGAALIAGLPDESGESALPSDASAARRGDDDSDRLTSTSKPRFVPERAGVSAPSSGKLTVRDHARLAERLADNIGRLRQARLTHDDDSSEARDRLEAFLLEDLVPSLQAEESALRDIAGQHRRTGWWAPRAHRRLQQRLHEHRQVIDAAHALQLADTTVLALARAEDVRALFLAHLVGEDRELVTAASAGADEDSDTVAISAELDELLAHDHARITAAVTAARDAAANGSDDELGACDRAVAAVSQHAAVMSTRAYPMVRRVRSGPDRAATRALTGDLRCAERAMRHLNRLLRGAAGEDPSFRNRDRLWNDVERSWQHHVAGEEPLMRRMAPLLGPERVVSLITLLRRPVGHSLTRPHPQLLHGGWPTGLAIRVQYRFDRWRDDLDNRVTWRTGR